MCIIIVFNVEKSSPIKKRNFFNSLRSKKQLPLEEINGDNYKMAGNESALKDLTHPGHNEPLKSHNSVTFKLVRTGKFVMWLL